MNRFIKASSLLGLLLLFASVSVSAQTASNSAVTVPFQFSVGNKSYEAGKYNLRIAKAVSGSKILTIADEKHNILQVVFLHANGHQLGDDTRLVFEKVGDKRFLSGVRLYGNTFALPRSKEHKLELAKTRNKETLIARI